MVRLHHPKTGRNTNVREKQVNALLAVGWQRVADEPEVEEAAFFERSAGLEDGKGFASAGEDAEDAEDTEEVESEPRWSGPLD